MLLHDDGIRWPAIGRFSSLVGDRNRVRVGGMHVGQGLRA